MFLIIGIFHFESVQVLQFQKFNSVLFLSFQYIQTVHCFSSQNCKFSLSLWELQWVNYLLYRVLFLSSVGNTRRSSCCLQRVCSLVWSWYNSLWGYCLHARLPKSVWNGLHFAWCLVGECLGQHHWACLQSGQVLHSSWLPFGKLKAQQKCNAFDCFFPFLLLWQKWHPYNSGWKCVCIILLTHESFLLVLKKCAV